MTSVLRPELYRRLVQAFGSVRLAHPGEPFQDVHSKGETYRVNCPFCGDRRHRLYINHQWGREDEFTGRRRLGLCICWNAQCVNDPERRLQLYDMVFASGLAPEADVLVAPEEPADDDEETAEACLPGRCVLLSALPSSHEAVRYLEGRGFDPVRLATRFWLCFCEVALPPHRNVESRLIVPITQGHKLVGWQARAVRPPAHRGEPKYLTMRGFRKAKYLYNYDAAVRSSFVVVVEGVSDVWRFGDEAVALFGNTASAWQQMLLLSNWSRIVIMLDADAEDQAQRLTASLASSGRARVVRVSPGASDPGAADTAWLRRRVAEALSL